MDTIRNIISQRLGTFVKGSIDGDSLFTQRFLDTYKSMVKGIFNAITRPTSIIALIQTHQLSSQLFESVLKELEIEKSIPGEIANRRERIYTPHIFEKQRRQWILSFYGQNGYLEYQSLSKWDVGQPSSYLEGVFDSEKGNNHEKEYVPLYLTSVCIESGKINQTEHYVQEVVDYPAAWIDFANQTSAHCESKSGDKETKSKGTESNTENVIYNHLCDLLPFQLLSAKDVEVILKDHCSPALKFSPQKDWNVAWYSDYQLLVTRHLFDSTLATFEKMAKQKFETGLFPLTIGENTTPNNNTNNNNSNNSTSKVTEITKKKTQGKGSKAANSKSKTKVEEDVEDPNSVEGEEIERQFQQLSTEFFQKSNNSNSGSNNNNNNNNRVGLYENLPPNWWEEIMSSDLKKLFQRIREESKVLLVRNAAESKKQQQLKFSSDFSTLLGNIQLFTKSLDYFSNQVEERLLLEKYLMRTLVTDLTHLLLINQLSYIPGQLPDVNLFNSVAERNQALVKLPVVVQQNLQKLYGATQTTVADYLQILETVADKFEIQVRPLDKKSERNLFLTQKFTLCDQLGKEENPGVVLHLAVVLLMMKKHNIVVHPPGKFVITLLTKLKDNLDISTFQKLSEFSNRVVTFLASKQTAIPPELQQSTEEIKTLISSILQQEEILDAKKK
jgi:hypothetical protein